MLIPRTNMRGLNEGDWGSIDILPEQAKLGCNTVTEVCFEIIREKSRAGKCRIELLGFICALCMALMRLDILSNQTLSYNCLKRSASLLRIHEIINIKVFMARNENLEGVSIRLIHIYRETLI